MHQALYRKWRPRTFDDVCGQEHITSVLRYEVANNALSHAYLFCGSRGTGKTTCAKILAKAANCENPKNGSPCGECAACRLIDAGSATDVIEMDAASNNGVDAIRDIRDEVVYTPNALRYRVYIVDEVHMLSTGAFNALLKTLEEPPAHVIFVLATTELHKLPTTIVSRCQRFDFRRIAASVLADRISYIAREEGIALESAAAARIAKLAQGGMRDAISMLELCASGRDSVSLSTVNDILGSSGREGMYPVLRALVASDYDAIFAAIDNVASSSRDIAVFWQDLISIYRDMLVIKTTENATRYLDLTDMEFADLTAFTTSFSRATLLAHCRLLEDALFAMQGANAVKRIVAELTLVRMCDPKLDTSPESLLARVAKLEDSVATGAIAPVSYTPVAPVAPAAAAPTVTEAPAMQAAAMPAVQEAPMPTSYVSPMEASLIAKAPVKQSEQAAPTTGRTLTRVRGFMSCVERIRRENSMLASFIMDARVFLDENGHVICKLQNDFAQMLLDEPQNREQFARALAAEIGRQIDPAHIRIEVPDATTDKNDTVLDDLIEAAEQ